MGVSDTKEGEVVHITWDNVPESRNNSYRS